MHGRLMPSMNEASGCVGSQWCYALLVMRDRNDDDDDDDDDIDFVVTTQSLCRRLGILSPSSLI